jgi:hypothetical protein
MLEDRTAQQHMAEVAALVSHFEPALYRVASAHAGANNS